jgi:uncharacterized protein (DUF433 family)
MLLFDKDDPVLELPAYPLSDAASYVHVPYQTLRYWALGRGSMPPLIELPDQTALSFLNLLECHVLSALRSNYNLPIKVVRKGLDKLASFYSSKHPLLENTLSTDGIDLFLDSAGEELINLSRGGQAAMREILSTYLQRIVYSESGIPKFFPFVLKDRATADEPRMISIVPTIAFGRSVIDGTGIATAVIAARFHAREPIPALAKEYGRSESEIQEAVIWETNRTAKAA